LEVYPLGKGNIKIPFEPIEAFHILKNQLANTTVATPHWPTTPCKKCTVREIWPNAAYFRPSQDYGQVK